MDRRRHLREPVRIFATAVAEDGLARLPVTVINVSRWGARIRHGRNGVPERFHLLFGNSLEPCEVVWREGGEMGLIFIPTEFG